MEPLLKQIKDEVDKVNAIVRQLDEQIDVLERQRDHWKRQAALGTVLLQEGDAFKRWVENVISLGLDPKEFFQQESVQATSGTETVANLDMSALDRAIAQMSKKSFFVKSMQASTRELVRSYTFTEDQLGQMLWQSIYNIRMIKTGKTGRKVKQECIDDILKAQGNASVDG